MALSGYFKMILRECQQAHLDLVVVMVELTVTYFAMTNSLQYLLLIPLHSAWALGIQYTSFFGIVAHCYFIPQFC